MFLNSFYTSFKTLLLKSFYHRILISNMSVDAVNCLLRSLEDPTKNITLPDNKTVYLGRNEETSICDLILSRKQVAATADYRRRTVLIEPSGTNHSGCNGYALKKGCTYYLQHNDCLELLIGRYKFEVVFDPPLESDKEAELGSPAFKKKKPNFPVFDTGKLSIPEGIRKPGTWEHIDDGALLIYTPENVKSQAKVAAFDLDGTLIKTKSGARFSKSVKDWMLNFPNLREKLQKLFDKDFKIVIFSNQAGIGGDKTRIACFKHKIEDILSCIAIPIQVFIATSKSMYRKPVPGMWYSLCNEKNDDIVIDVAESFYVGDAAGRPKDWVPKRNKDHSISDRLFAMNLNMKFYTPEEYFLKWPQASFAMPKFDPRNLSTGDMPLHISNDYELIMMVGCPASGKTYYCKNYLIGKGYAHINRDTIGSWQRCVKLVEDAMKNKQKIVVDNTSPDKITRSKYIEIAKRYNYPVRCILMTTSFEHCKHNNKFRTLTDTSHAVVTDIILHIYKKSFQEPSPDEGYTEVIKLDFKPSFKNANQEKLYKMFLLES